MWGAVFDGRKRMPRQTIQISDHLADHDSVIATLKGPLFVPYSSGSLDTALSLTRHHHRICSGGAS